MSNLWGRLLCGLGLHDLRSYTRHFPVSALMPDWLRFRETCIRGCGHDETDWTEVKRIQHYRDWGGR